jgi:hypothetical protein
MPASLAAIALLVALAPPAPVKPWEEVGDIGCSWWLSGPDGKTHRASIGTGDDDPVLTIDDSAFVAFPEYGRVPVTVRFDGDPKRTATATAWTGIVIGGERSLGMFLDKRARRALGGARRIEVMHEGKTLLDLPLARTPSRAELEKCTFPKGRKGDQE